MAATFAIVLAVVAFSCAADARHGTSSRPRVVYEWVSLSKLNRNTYNMYKTYMFVDASSQKLNWNVEFLHDMPNVKLDMQVMRQNGRGEWEMMHRIKNAPLCSQADTTESRVVSAYAVLLGLQSSNPPVVQRGSRSQSSQTESAESGSAQSRESQSQESMSQSAAGSQSGESQESQSVSASSSEMGACRIIQGVYNLKSFSPAPHKISPILKSGMHLVQFRFKRYGETTAVVDLMVDMWL